MGYNIWPKIMSSQSQKHQQPSISIELLESVLYNHPAHQPVLRGVVELKSKHPIAVTSLRLYFHGHLDYRLVKPAMSCQKKFAECSLPLYPASLSHPLVIQDQGDKSTRFVFEMPLPNNTESCLIQSTRCKEFQVKYQINAIFEYQPLELPETYHKRRSIKSSYLIESPPYPIVIIQIPTYEDGSSIFTSDNMLTSIDSRKQSNHWCQYRVKIDKRFAAISSMLSLSVRLAPLIHGLKLAQVSMHIVQRFTTSSTQKTLVRPPLALECHYQSTPYPSSSTKQHPGGTLYEGEFQYKIPSSTLLETGLVPSIPANAVSDIQVEHHLLVYLALTYPKISHDGILRRARRIFTFQCDFDLLHPSISDQFLRLPAYATQEHCSVTLDEVFHQVSTTPPLYDQAVLLPPAVL